MTLRGEWEAGIVSLPTISLIIFAFVFGGGFWATTQIKFIVSDISLVIIITHIYYLFINLFCMRIMRDMPGSEKHAPRT